MEDSESLLKALGIATEGVDVPDEVWAKAVAGATDPDAPVADAGLVPDMDDEPVVPDDEDLILDNADLSDDTDGQDDSAHGVDITDPDFDPDTDASAGGNELSVSFDSDETTEPAHDVDLAAGDLGDNDFGGTGF
ncbi:MAG: hypothetical protein GX610_03630 [Rhodococcus sp.]|nr:hypothetical protein [Rhodococcus sp. (in: high G+C Gram-positive bacteria)]